jgi:hypothetical protein
LFLDEENPFIKIYEKIEIEKNNIFYYAIVEELL